MRPAGFEPASPSKRAATDPRLRPRALRDQPGFNSDIFALESVVKKRLLLSDTNENYPQLTSSIVDGTCTKFNQNSTSSLNDKTCGCRHDTSFAFTLCYLIVNA